MAQTVGTLLIDVKSNDELGQMSRIINKNIEATIHNIQTDKTLFQIQLKLLIKLITVI